MIDTVRFKIPYTQKLLNDIINTGVKVNLRYNSNSKEIDFVYYRGYKPLGSFNRNINLFLYEDRQEIYLELSLPKFIYGHNVFMLYPEEIETSLYLLQDNLNFVYNTIFPDPHSWTITRFDICYNWKFPNAELCDRILKYLETCEFPRKKTQRYTYGVAFLGGEYHNVKFYLKYPEFYNHDYKHLLKQDQEYAERIYNWSENILRFEVSIKRKYIKEKLKYNDYRLLIDNAFITDLLNQFFREFIKKGENTFTATEDAILSLFKAHKPALAGRLNTYWQLHQKYSEKVIEKILDVSRMTLYRYKKYINDINLGVQNDNIEFNINLAIPSDITTNLPLSLAREPQGSGEWENEKIVRSI